jgi:hypothetical protein
MFLVAGSTSDDRQRLRVNEEGIADRLLLRYLSSLTAGQYINTRLRADHSVGVRPKPKYTMSPQASYGCIRDWRLSGASSSRWRLSCSAVPSLEPDPASWYLRTRPLPRWKISRLGKRRGRRRSLPKGQWVAPQPQMYPGSLFPQPILGQWVAPQPQMYSQQTTPQQHVPSNPSPVCTTQRKAIPMVKRKQVKSLLNTVGPSTVVEAIKEIFPVSRDIYNQGGLCPRLKAYRQMHWISSSRDIYVVAKWLKRGQSLSVRLVR